jgi:tetrahydromethanopterin S-methyltransferase subunit G
MCWVNWLGVGLQVLGLAGAMVLLGRLRETVTGQEGALLRWSRAAWRWLRVGKAWLLRRPAPRPSVHAHAQTAMAAGFAGGAHGVTTRGGMPNDLAVTDQVAWVTDYVRDLEHRHNELASEVRRQASAQDDAVKAARDHAETEIRQAVEDVRTEVRQLVGKDVGLEIGFLAVVVVGVVLAAL